MRPPRSFKRKYFSRKEVITWASAALLLGASFSALAARLISFGSQEKDKRPKAVLIHQKEVMEAHSKHAAPAPKPKPAAPAAAAPKTPPAPPKPVAQAVPKKQVVKWQVALKAYEGHVKKLERAKLTADRLALAAKKTENPGWKSQAEGKYKGVIVGFKAVARHLQRDIESAKNPEAKRMFEAVLVSALGLQQDVERDLEAFLAAMKAKGF
jgi:hypothetical protein